MAADILVQRGSTEDPGFPTEPWTPDRRPGPYERFAKPTIDRLGALVLLVVLAPVLLVVAMAVLLSLGHPVLYRQARVGMGGTTFEMLKFRTMERDRRVRQVPVRGPDRRRRHKTPDDPRHTRLGSFLRRYSLDELPQLWNVLRGDLSLVGPRPELVTVVDSYEPWQHRRHVIKPGLTGLWQVTERDHDGLMHLHVDTDCRYVETLSARLDLWILARTLPAVLGFSATGLPPGGSASDRRGESRHEDPAAADGQRPARRTWRAA